MTAGGRLSQQEHSMNGFRQDLRHGLRLFARTPGFTVTAVLVLAVGIGINTAVFTATNALLLAPLGGPAPGALAGIFARDARPGGTYRPFSGSDYRELAAAAKTSPAVASLMAYEMATVGITEDRATRKTYACVASSSYFDTLGVTLAAGRGFLPAEESSSAQPAAVVSRAYWERNGRDAVLGRAVVVNNRAFTIVGVVPEGFSGTTALLSPELWLPLGAAPLLQPRDASPGSGRAHSLMVVARLRPGLSPDAAGPLVAPLAARLREASPMENEKLEISAGPLSRFSMGAGPRDDAEVAGVLFFLMGMASVVLLIACLNLANMLLARGGARSREVAVRLAVGGSRARIVRQLLTESMLLSSAGAAAGLAMSFAVTALLFRALSAVLPLPVVFDATPDLRTLAAAAAFATLATLAFGLGPALRMTGGDIVPPLKDQGAPAARWRGLPVRNLLAVAQLALCLALLTAAGLFVQGAFRAGNADPGFPLDRGVVASTDASLAGYDEPRGREAYRQVLARLRSLPDIESVSLASAVPLGLEGSYRGVRSAGDATTGEPAVGSTVIVGSAYFATVGLPLLRGRDFTLAEEASAAPSRPAVVDVTLAQRLWPNDDPLGQRLQLEVAGDGSAAWTAAFEVVGIVAGVRDGLFDKVPTPHVYLPFGSEYAGSMHVHARLRSSGPAAAEAAVTTLRREILAADSRLPILSLRTLRDHRESSVYVWMARASAHVFAAFGLSALVLAVLGVYGVKAYLVSRRTREIGIRLALGATRLDVLRLVLRDGLWLTVGGLLAGAALALALSKVLTAWVYGIGGLGLEVLLAAAVVLGAAALLACYLPARRVIGVAPSVALRAE
jgi:predicted permease